MRYAIIARDGTDPEAKARRLAVRPAHLERVAPFVERGRVLIGGAILDEAGDMVGLGPVDGLRQPGGGRGVGRRGPLRHRRGLEGRQVLDFRPAVGAWLPDDCTPVRTATGPSPGSESDPVDRISV